MAYGAAQRRLIGAVAPAVAVATAVAARFADGAAAPFAVPLLQLITAERPMAPPLALIQ